MRRNQQGFSLVEVMVVIAIIGILATMVLPNVLGNQEKANEQKVIADIVALENALAQYHLDNGMFPTTEQGLEALVNEPNMDPRPRSYRGGGYIRRLPPDPYGNDYFLLDPGQDDGGGIFFPGPGGQPGTDGYFWEWVVGNNNRGH